MKRKKEVKEIKEEYIEKLGKYIIFLKKKKQGDLTHTYHSNMSMILLLFKEAILIMMI